MKVGMLVPVAHVDLNEYTDFGFYSASHLLINEEYAAICARDLREVWIDCTPLQSYDQLDHIFRITAPDVLIGPIWIIGSTASDCVARFIKRAPHDRVEKVIVWTGSRSSYELASAYGDVVAATCAFSRTQTMQQMKIRGDEVHLLEVRNLDEVRRLKPHSVSTYLPIAAALRGIAIELRQRRPVRLPRFDPGLKLSISELKLAIENLKAVKDAGAGTREG